MMWSKSLKSYSVRFIPVGIEWWPEVRNVAVIRTVKIPLGYEVPAVKGRGIKSAVGKMNGKVTQMMVKKKKK